MTPEQAFSLANLVAVAAWVVLVIVGRSRRGMMAVTAVVIPSLALVYAGLLLTHWGETEGGFGSLAQVRALFANPWALLAGWIHYLAFDLFVGAWEIRDSAERGISHYLVIPCLALTFLFGPIGLLLYLGVRQFKTGRVRPAWGTGEPASPGRNRP